jgi:hypothetical protein
MTDHGNIAVLDREVDFPDILKRRYCNWISPPPATIVYVQTPIDGRIAGVVNEAGSPIVGAWVHLYYRATGILIDRVQSGADGVFQFVDLDTSDDQYFVVALDPAGGAVYNAIIFDTITPVPL